MTINHNETTNKHIYIDSILSYIVNFPWSMEATTTHSRTANYVRLGAAVADDF